MRSRAEPSRPLLCRLPQMATHATVSIEGLRAGRAWTVLTSAFSHRCAPPQPWLHSCLECDVLGSGLHRHKHKPSVVRLCGTLMRTC